MKLFLEIERNPTQEEEEKGIPLPFIRIEVASREEARTNTQILLPFIPGGKAYLHLCRHDEIPPGPCEREEL